VIGSGPVRSGNARWCRVRSGMADAARLAKAGDDRIRSGRVGMADAERCCMVRRRGGAGFGRAGADWSGTGKIRQGNADQDKAGFDWVGLGRQGVMRIGTKRHEKMRQDSMRRGRQGAMRPGLGVDGSGLVWQGRRRLVWCDRDCFVLVGLAQAWQAR
jgi:hypothetical protein